jgi:uncharacterized RDD family membrane protein YckC
MGVESYQDQLSIETPEHVALRLPLAGVGSRFLAVFMDTLIQVVAYILLVVALVLLATNTSVSSHAAPMSARAAAWTTAILIFLHFLAFWGYYALFEGLWRGQTPGKRIFKLRVIKDSGRQITLVEAMARNLLRVADALPVMYLVGIIAILCNKQRQRLGDLMAGTVVVHAEDLGEWGALSDASRTITAGFFVADGAPQAVPHVAQFPAHAIARLTADDLILLDTFFARIPELDVHTKDQIAQRLLRTLCAKMQIPEPADVSPRLLLDAIAYELRNYTGMSSRRFD